MGEAPSESLESAKELTSQLRHALLIMLRYTRGGRRTDAGRSDPLVQELHDELAAVLDEHGAVHLRVGVAALYHSDDAVLEFSPREDLAMFRLFQHGVRQLSFHPGLSFEQTRDLLSVLVADFSALEHAEDDVTTLLASMDLQHVQFVVVETFSEGAGDEDGGGQGNVGAIMAEAIRETLSGQPEQEGAHNSVRFWQADVKLLERENIAELVASLPKVGSDAGSSELLDDEIRGFAEELGISLVRYDPWLPWSGLSVYRLCEDEHAERLAAILGGEINAAIWHHGLDKVTEELSMLLRWIDDAKGTPPASYLAESLLTDACVKALLGGLDDPSIERPVLLRALTFLPESRVPGALRAVCLRPPSPARNDAIKALLSYGTTDLADVADVFATVEGETALALLEPLQGMEASEDVLTFYRAAFAHGEPAVRMRALAWFAYRGEGHALGALRTALRDSSEEVRTAALHLIVQTRPRGMHGVMKAWFEDELFDNMALDEKRRGALLFAHLTGSPSAEIFRRVAKGGALLTRRQAEETRAAAIAALGFLADDESTKLLTKLAKKGRGVVQEEAQLVTNSREQGRPPYEDPETMLAARVAELELTGYLADSPLASAAADADWMPTMIGPELSLETPPAEAPTMGFDGELLPVPDLADLTATVPPVPPQLSSDDARALLDGFAFDDLPPMPQVEGPDDA